MEKDARNINKIMFSLLFSMFIVILNQTLINVALPQMIRDLKVTTTTAQWLITGFMLVNGILIPISAYFIKRFGFRNLLLASMIFFTLGSLVCALSDSFPIVMTGRVIQAIGAGIMMPLGMNVFMFLFPAEKRGAAMGIAGIAMILAPAIGPTISGLVVEHYNWEIMFYGMFVLGLICLFTAFRWFHVEVETQKAKLDLLGTVLSTIGFGGLLYGFSEAGTHSWGDSIVWISLVIGTVSLAAFIISQLYAKEPLLEFHVFKSSMFTMTTIINAINTMALFGGMILLPLYLQNILGFSAVKAGLLMLPGSLLMGIMGPITGRIFDKHGVKWLAIIGLTITTFATWEFTNITTHTSYNYLITLYIIRSFGMSLLAMPIMTAGINALDPKLISHGNAMGNTLRTVAGSIGTALLVTVMTSGATQYGVDHASELQSVTDPTLLDSAKQALINEAQVHGITQAFWLATIFAATALVLSFFLKGKKK